MKSLSLRARIFREKLSMMLWRYAFVQSRSLITDVSMCQISLDFDTRIPVDDDGCLNERGH